MNKQKILIILCAVLGGLLLSMVLYALQKNEGGHEGLMAVTEDAFGGPFTLTDHTGKTVTEKDFSGQYRLMYFGFTFCPAICPTELGKITAAMKMLGEDGNTIKPIFVTVDPARDTPEKLKNYVTLFHPNLVGLTGTDEQIKIMLKAYKIYAAKVEDESLSEYTMDHSSFIYLIAPDDRLLHIFKITDTADFIADITRQWLAKN